MMIVECKVCNATMEVNAKSLAAIKKNRVFTKLVNAFFVEHYHDGRYDPKRAFLMMVKEVVKA